MRGANSDFGDLVKIAQTFLHRPANLPPTESKVCALNCGSWWKLRPQPV
jgi:aspartyl/asparaginyl beta-hydroxylase (cupin superfamily)